MLKSKRLYGNIIVFGIFFLLAEAPWYLPFILGAIFLWLIGNYYEYILLGFIMDISYGSGHLFSIFYHKFPLPFTVSAAAMFLAFQIIKKRIRVQ